ncbi:MAG: 5'/3'-nucleotidase SurE [Candidatus Binatia bacterium]
MILVSNDDGIHSEGLRALHEAMSRLDEVVVVAPDRERGAVSHSLTLHRPLRVTEVAPRWYAIDGTPADCVFVALNRVLHEAPRLAVSGINRGPNLGDDVTYSGTVGAAMEAALVGVPAIAFSLAARDAFRFEAAAGFAGELAAAVLREGMPSDVFLNVNVPEGPPEAIRSFAVTRLGRRRYSDSVSENVDPRGRKYYWIGGDEIEPPAQPGTDVAAVRGGAVSVTPIHVDLTHHGCVERIARMDVRWP